MSIRALYLFIAVQLSCTYSIFGKKHDILKKEKTLWISEEYITAMLNYSFPETRCCIVHINRGKSWTIYCKYESCLQEINPNSLSKSLEINDEESMIFKSFVSVYQNQYFLNSGKYECSDYLFIMTQDYQIIRILQRQDILLKL